MKDFHFKFYLGKREKTIKQWVVYSIGTATAVSLVVHFGNVLLASKYGEIFRDAVCSASKVFPDGDIARALSSACQASKDRVITPDEAKKIIDRVAKSTGVATDYFDSDQANLNLRAEDEVAFAIESWKRANLGPKIDPALREQFPDFTEDQLCVLSQAERYTDGDAIGIRYAGMEVCEE